VFVSRQSNGYAVRACTTSIDAQREIAERIARGTGNSQSAHAERTANLLAPVRLWIGVAPRGGVCDCGFSVKTGERGDRL